MSRNGRIAEEETAKAHEEKGQEPPRGEEQKENNESREPPFYKRRSVLIPFAAGLIVVIVAAVLYDLHARKFESTDDADVDGHIIQIAPQVSALVRTLHVDDNQFVHQGDLVIELDPTNFVVALEQAQAQLVSSQGRLAQSQAQLQSAQAAVTQAAAEIDAALVALDNTTRDLQRYQNVDERARSRQQLDNAIAAQKNAQAQLEQTRARKTAAEANVATAAASIKAAEGEVQTSAANLARAQVNLSYCQLYAPSDGRVTQRTVEAGNFVEAGQTLFMLVRPDVWITANYKETQLENMRPGQPATIEVDAFPGTEFHGHVDSIQAGSGSRFGILPPENATGNFVKIVQRVPVKIVFDHDSNTNDAGLLSPGLSVIPKVQVR